MYHICPCKNSSGYIPYRWEGALSVDGDIYGFDKILVSMHRPLIPILGPKFVIFPLGLRGKGGMTLKVNYQQ